MPLAMAGCKKECPEYHQQNGDDCVAYSQLFSGTWQSQSQPTCSNGALFVQTITLTEGPAANTVGLTDGLFLVATDAHHANGGPWQMTDGQGTNTVTVEVVRFDAVYTTNYNNAGVNIGQTLTQPERIIYTVIRNPGAADQMTCTGTYSK